LLLRIAMPLTPALRLMLADTSQSLVPTGSTLRFLDAV
jgi:hypothetical protein